MSAFGDLPFAAAVGILAVGTVTGVALVAWFGSLWMLAIVAVVVALLATLYLREYSQRPPAAGLAAPPVPTEPEEEFDDPVIAADRMHSAPASVSESSGPPTAVEPIVPGPSGPPESPEADDGVE